MDQIGADIAVESWQFEFLSFQIKPLFGSWIKNEVFKLD